MGDKIEAKRTAKRLGIPGGARLRRRHHRRRRSAQGRTRDRLSGAGEGGGRRRRARHEGRAYARPSSRPRSSTARTEAKAAFGDDAVYLEKYLQKPRHIEIQVLGDGRGNAIHLGERDCSLQRRHQKVLEESPSPALNVAARDKIGEIVAEAMRELKYLGVGTVEFLYEDGEFYFIEMNTRIQVEHPVTEMITDIDLILEQIRVAAGADLALAQKRRELPRPRDRMPHQCGKPGLVPPLARKDLHYHPPGGLGVRVDSAVYQGYTIPPYYDSLVGKLIVHGKTRAECLMRLKRALDEFVVDGIETTLPLFRDAGAQPGHHRRRLSHPLARAVPRRRRDGRLTVRRRPSPAPSLHARRKQLATASQASRQAVGLRAETPNAETSGAAVRAVDQRPEAYTIGMSGRISRARIASSRRSCSPGRLMSVNSTSTGCVGSEMPQRFRGIRDGMNRKSVFGQRLANHFGDEDFVLDHQNGTVSSNATRLSLPEQSSATQQTAYASASNASLRGMCSKCRKFNGKQG